MEKQLSLHPRKALPSTRPPPSRIPRILTLRMASKLLLRIAPGAHSKRFGVTTSFFHLQVPYRRVLTANSVPDTSLGARSTSRNQVPSPEQPHTEQPSPATWAGTHQPHYFLNSFDHALGPPPNRQPPLPSDRTFAHTVSRPTRDRKDPAFQRARRCKRRVHWRRQLQSVFAFFCAPPWRFNTEGPYPWDETAVSLSTCPREACLPGASVIRLFAVPPRRPARICV